MSYELIENLQKKAVTVSQACRTLEVSRSGYYAAAKRRSTAPVVCAASVHLKAAFAASGRTYGSRRLRTALHMSGVTMGRHRVRSLMRASSGKVTRHRLNRGGDRAANSALHIIAIGRLRTDPRSQAYVARRVAEGHSKLEAIRCLKRFIAREVFGLIRQRAKEIAQSQIAA